MLSGVSSRALVGARRDDNSPMKNLNSNFFSSHKPFSDKRRRCERGDRATFGRSSNKQNKYSSHDRLNINWKSLRCPSNCSNDEFCRSFVRSRMCARERLVNSHSKSWSYDILNVNTLIIEKTDQKNCHPLLYDINSQRFHLHHPIYCQSDDMFTARKEEKCQTRGVLSFDRESPAGFTLSFVVCEAKKKVAH